MLQSFSKLHFNLRRTLPLRPNRRHVQIVSLSPTDITVATNESLPAPLQVKLPYSQGLPDPSLLVNKPRISPCQRKFHLVSDYQPTGDQPNAIQFLTDGLRMNRKFQTLQGCTGTGKTYIMANIIANINRPTLVLAPNKTLAAQLCSEFSRFFPHNAVEYFVSHFKHYQPEAYLPSTDKYIAKSSVVDKHIDRLRHAATKSLFERSDTIVVASVSSIYGLGLPSEYLNAAFSIQVGQYNPNAIAHLAGTLSELAYVSDLSDKVYTTRGLYKVDENVIDLSPPWEPEGTIIRISFQNDRVVDIKSLDVVSGKTEDLSTEGFVIYPAKHFATGKELLEKAIKKIEHELEERVSFFTQQGKLLEASRLQDRVTADIEMMRKVGFCSGMENYTKYLSGRENGEAPETLLDYMPQNGGWLLLIDESHVTVPQLGAMHAGNAARKRKLVQYGFRLPSSMENRPLSSREFWRKASQTIFVSATPSSFELEKSAPSSIVEALIRPSFIVDPNVEVVGTRGQIEDLTRRLAQVVARGGKAIVTTVTKRFAEDLSDCLNSKPPVCGVLNRSLRVSFLHSGIDSVGRMQVLEMLRENRESESDDEGEASLDVVVGVNLLREGLDLPKCELVAILDADSEGFLRGETALIQTIGRAARNINGCVIMYADTITGAMQRAIAETKRRRRIQLAYNKMHRKHATPVGGKVIHSVEDWSVLNRIRKLSVLEGCSIPKRLQSQISASKRWDGAKLRQSTLPMNMSDPEELRKMMLEAAEEQDYEMAALLRDRYMEVQLNSSVEVQRSLSSNRSQRQEIILQ